MKTLLFLVVGVLAVQLISFQLWMHSQNAKHIERTSTVLQNVSYPFFSLPSLHYEKEQNVQLHQKISMHVSDYDYSDQVSLKATNSSATSSNFMVRLSTWIALLVSHFVKIPGSWMEVDLHKYTRESPMECNLTVVEEFKRRNSLYGKASQADNLANHLATVADVLNKLNIPFFIVHGTLLGWYRYVITKTKLSLMKRVPLHSIHDGRWYWDPDRNFVRKKGWYP